VVIFLLDSERYVFSNAGAFIWITWGRQNCYWVFFHYTPSPLFSLLGIGYADFEKLA
jgi:hypothetical protein